MCVVGCEVLNVLLGVCVCVCGMCEAECMSLLTYVSANVWPVVPTVPTWMSGIFLDRSPLHSPGDLLSSPTETGIVGGHWACPAFIWLVRT